MPPKYIDDYDYDSVGRVGDLTYSSSTSGTITYWATTDDIVYTSPHYENHLTEIGRAHV